MPVEMTLTLVLGVMTEGRRLEKGRVTIVKTGWTRVGWWDRPWRR